MAARGLLLLLLLLLLHLVMPTSRGTCRPPSINEALGWLRRRDLIRKRGRRPCRLVHLLVG